MIKSLKTVQKVANVMQIFKIDGVACYVCAALLLIASSLLLAAPQIAESLNTVSFSSRIEQMEMFDMGILSLAAFIIVLMSVLLLIF